MDIELRLNCAVHNSNLAGWPAACWPAGWPAGWLAGWPVGWLAGRPAAWLPCGHRSCGFPILRAFLAGPPKRGVLSRFRGALSLFRGVISPSGRVPPESRALSVGRWHVPTGVAFPEEGRGGSLDNVETAC